MQDDSPADHGEEGLQAQQQRDDRRVAVLLRENLQRVAARAREDADVEDVERTLAERREIDRFKGEGADGGEDHHHRELHAGERDAVHLLHIMVHAEDMPREGKGTQENEEVAAAEAHRALAAREAEEIKTDHCDQNAEEQPFVCLFPEEHAGERHEHDVERRDEARLARRGIGNAELLQVRAERQKNAAHEAALQQVLFLLRRVFFLVPHAPQDEHERPQHQHSGDRTRRREGKAAHFSRAEALCHERAAPNE